MRPPVPQQRGVSPVVGTVVLVGIVVILAGGVSVAVFGISDRAPEDAGPYSTAQIDGEIEEPSGCGGGSDKMVTLEHAGGDSIPVEHLEVHVIGESSNMQMVDLPMKMDSYNRPKSHHIEGNDDLMWSLINDGCAKGPYLSRTSADVWRAGQEIGFLVGSDVDSGDTLKIKLVDTEANRQISEQVVEIT